MKKLLIFFMLMSSICYSHEYIREGYVCFKVQSNHYYEFKIHLKHNSCYCFKLNGNSVFNFKIVEPSGNEWELQRAYYNDTNWQLIVRENILDAGEYSIKIYSIADNMINMSWMEY